MTVVRLPVPPDLLRLGYGALTAPRARRFALALDTPMAAQAATLERVVRLATGSPYARHIGLRGATRYEDFRKAVPFVEYEDLRPWIERQVQTGVPMLSSEHTVVYERTSGSSGKSKLVPYTPSLLSSFNAAFLVWSHDLVRHGPPFRTGRIFLSLSPALQTDQRTTTGVPVSLADDAAYLAPWVQRLLRRSFFVPAAIKRIRDPDTYRRTLATLLVAEQRLEVVSVWSPTYLLALLEAVTRWRGRIAADLRQRHTGPQDCRVSLAPARAARLALLERDPIPWLELWPDLKLISCWSDGASAAFVPALRRAFPSVAIQGKGLLSTEAPITIPLVRATAPVPLLDEVFLEFQAENGEILPLHELEDGRDYAVIVSQSGGLLRYRTHDRVRAEGRLARTPCLRFLGAERVSDLVGEKLGSEFVGRTLTTTLGSDDHCSFLLPERSGTGASGYRCVTDHPLAAGSEAELAGRLDAALQSAFQYRQARHLGQLAPLQLSYSADARKTYEAMALARGVKWGGIKFEPLLTCRSDETEIEIRRAPSQRGKVGNAAVELPGPHGHGDGDT